MARSSSNRKPGHEKKLNSSIKTPSNIENKKKAAQKDVSGFFHLSLTDEQIKEIAEGRSKKRREKLQEEAAF